MRIGMVLKGALGEDGAGLFAAWSAVAMPLVVAFLRLA